MTLPASPSDVTTFGMPTTPTIGFVNYGGIPVTDPTTDQDAAAYNQLLADVAQMTRTAPRAIAQFVTAASTGAMSLVSHQAMWGSAPAVAPALARSAGGIFTVAWPTTVTDPLGITQTLNLKYGIGCITGATYQQAPQVVISSANVATVNTFSGGTANDIVGTTITVFAY